MAQNLGGTLALQAKQINRLKAEIQSVLGGKGEEQNQQFEAFDIEDQTLVKYGCYVKFSEYDFVKKGRINVDHRISTFTIQVKKSHGLESKFIEATVSSDPQFKKPNKTIKVALENQAPVNGQRIPVDFETGFCKFMYFKFEVIENEKDVIEDVCPHAHSED